MIRRRVKRPVRRVVLVFCLSAGGWACSSPAAQLLAIVGDGTGDPVPEAVVVATPVEGSPVPAPAPGEAVIAQENTQFDPYVTAVRVGTAVRFPNHDDILHNVYSFSKAKRFQLPLYADEPPAPVVFDRPGVVALGCNIHDWMIAYVYVVESRFFARSDTHGRARIDGLPSGRYRLHAWHPLVKRRAALPEQMLRIDSGDEDIRVTLALPMRAAWHDKLPKGRGG